MEDFRNESQERFQKSPWKYYQGNHESIEKSLEISRGNSGAISDECFGGISEATQGRRFKRIPRKNTEGTPTRISTGVPEGISGENFRKSLKIIKKIP